MERLTVKTGIGYLNKLGGTGKTYTKYDLLNDFDRCIQKLGKLEDIEQELGIPLEVLFKALKDGIYTTEYRNGLSYEFGRCLTIEYFLKGFSFKEYECEKIAYFRDLNKTWALTREELE